MARCISAYRSRRMVRANSSREGSEEWMKTEFERYEVGLDGIWRQTARRLQFLNFMTCIRCRPDNDHVSRGNEEIIFTGYQEDYVKTEKQ